MKPEIANILNKPFDTTVIKTRKNRYGESLNYVEGSHYIRRLNEAFGYNWSFEIVDMKVLKDEVIVLGKLTADGITKMQYGTSGESANDDRLFGDKVKAAGTDALRKCASLFGLGLHLYEGSSHNGSSDSNSKGNGNNGHPEGNDPHEDGETRLTSKQLKAIHAIRTRLEITDAGLKELCQRRYGKSPDYLSKKQASELIEEMKRRADGENSYEHPYNQ